MMSLPLNTIVCSDALEYLKSLPDNAVHCILTSPPYYMQRDYGVEGQIGLEPSFTEYLDKMTAIFNEARRVLRADGTLWLNMGDGYAGGGNNRGNNSPLFPKQASNGGAQGQVGAIPIPSGLKPKDLIGQPWRLAFRLQDDGWWLRQDIIWHKLNPMPESVTDRCTKAHEYVFLMTKSARYWYDAYAIREPHKEPERGRGEKENNSFTFGDNFRDLKQRSRQYNPAGRNKRSVWTVATHSFSEAHFATFPPKLIEPMILAGCPPKVCGVCSAPWERVVEVENVNAREWSPANGKSKELDPNFSTTRIRGNLQRYRDAGRDHDNPFPAKQSTGWHPTCAHTDAPTEPGIVLDPFMGAATTALVATQHGRRWMGCELNPEYIEIGMRRLSAVQVNMFTSEGL